MLGFSFKRLRCRFLDSPYPLELIQLLRMELAPGRQVVSDMAMHPREKPVVWIASPSRAGNSRGCGHYLRSIMADALAHSQGCVVPLLHVGETPEPSLI